MSNTKTDRNLIKIDRVKLEIRGTKRLSVEDLRKISQKIELDKGDTGFTRVMYRYYQKRGGLGNEIEVDKRYERPPTKIPQGAYCSTCDGGRGRYGPRLHDENCDSPHDKYLFSTVGLVNKELIGLQPKTKTPPELRDLRQRWLEGELTEEDIEETLGDGVKQTGGEVKILDSGMATDVRYRDVKPLSGKESAKENPSDWKNAVCIYYTSPKGTKTQFRVDGEGKVLVLEFPYEEYKDGGSVREIASRISKVIPGWKPKKPSILDMTVRSLVLADGEIELEKLKRELFPLTEDKRYASRDHIKAEQEYARGPSKLVLVGPELDGIPSLEIPLTEPPKLGKRGRMLFKVRYDNINYSIQIYKKGSVQINISYYNRTQTTKLSEKVIEPVIYSIYEILQELIIQRTKSKVKPLSPSQQRQSSASSKYSTVSGLTLPTREESSSSVCRGSKPNIPSPQPQPYSFKGKCPLPGQVIFPLEGVKGKDGKFYPCCGKLTKTGIKSEKKYRDLLLNGFPSDAAARKAGVPTTADQEDKLSGVLPKNFDRRGTSLQVKLPGREGRGWVNVKMENMERNGKFTVTRGDGEEVLISRKDIKPESRFRLGMSNLLKQRETELIEKFGNVKGNKLYKEYLCGLISSVGRVCPGGKSSVGGMTEEETIDITATLGSVPYFYLTYTEIQKLITSKYGVLSVPISSQIVAIRRGKEKNTGNVGDLENGSINTIKEWGGFKGTLVGNMYKSGTKNIFTLWKIAENGSEPGTPPPKWEVINALKVGGPVKENIVKFCQDMSESKLSNSMLIFVPIPRSGFNSSGSVGSSNTPLVWSSRGYQNKPHITVQLLEQLNKNKQTSEWVIGGNGRVFSRLLLGRRPKLTMKIKNTQITKMKLLDISTQERYVFVKPQFNREGALDNNDPFVVIGVASSSMPQRSLENTISMLVNRPPAKVFYPLKYKGDLALMIDGKYYVFDEDRKRLVKA